MALLEYKSQHVQDPGKIAQLMEAEGLGFAHWGTLPSEAVEDQQVLTVYRDEIAKLMEAGSYIQKDLVALHPTTPKLAEICAKFSRIHHHNEDEVRFTVAGEGVFEIASADGAEMLKITTHPGDLIVIPAMRRHLFYLTAKQHIRCIRLFQDAKGWEAIYEEPA